ncbi:MAG: class I SAM-dependent methyltransferase [Betaproteobacteria bacterium]|nr:class I SAM-dependent methyltransferase [Betaproteobacteria bacterium]MDE2122276.1 class I SAM-dependent methyltransferase [Betaproteobacteria bacterium]MDE2185979.1 class I SAM-dependent methyltransferase [Betaproteobacteria bacterium]MDE2323422.1 class I SAM-dependent methyltransferase [Betaproteobacteria bacterium]
MPDPSATTPPAPPGAAIPGFADARATWDARFAQPGLLFGAAPNAFLQREAGRLAPRSRVLGVADGEGRNAIWLAEQGHAVTAFDLSPVAVTKAGAWAAERGQPVEFHVAGVDDWAWTPRRFDAVVAIFVQFADPAMRQRLFAGMWQTLEHGGLLLLQGYTPKQLDYRTGGPGKLEHLYTEAMVRALLPQAEWLLLQEYEDMLTEGSGHAGRSALLAAVARKPDSAV